MNVYVQSYTTHIHKYIHTCTHTMNERTHTNTQIYSHVQYTLLVTKDV